MLYNLYFHQLGEYLNLTPEQLEKQTIRSNYNNSPIDENHYYNANPLGYLQIDNITYHRIKDYNTVMYSSLFNIQSIMEYGCGPANTAFILAMNGFFVDAFDYQSKVLDFQKSRERKILHYYNLEEYKQNNIQYDAVVCFEVFEHIEDPRLIIDSLNNHLKDKGYLFTTFSSEVGLSNINKDPEHICKLSNQEIFNYIISLGYKKINKIILPNGQSVDINYPMIFQKIGDYENGK